MIHADDLAGKTIGKYKVERLIGEGGMAYVYKAVNTENNDTVAIKVLFPEHTRQEETKLRFKREAEIQFQLTHPNLVRVFNLLDEEGLLGMAMEYVEGKDLKDYLNEKNELPTLHELQRIVLPVLKVIGFAHENQIVHRDLKPANIVMQGEKGREMPKVMDFGIAKSFTDTGWKTKTGLILGTPNYMAPELVLGKKIDHKVDIYAIGIMLYQMITTQLPFQGDDAISVIMAQCSREPPPLRTWLKDPDPRLEAIVMKAIAKEPGQRFANCEEFAKALASLPQNEIKLVPADAKDTSAATMIFDGDLLPDNPADIQPKAAQAPAPAPAPAPHAIPAGPHQPGSTLPPPKNSMSVLLPLLVLLSIGLTGVLFFLLGRGNKTKLIKPIPERRVIKTVPIKTVPVKVVKAIPDNRPTAIPDVPKRVVPRRPPPRRGPSCASQGSSKKCLRCVTQEFRKILRGSVGMMAMGQVGFCQKDDFENVGKRCYRSCGCNYLYYCASFMKQRFRSSSRGRKPAAKIRLCKQFVRARGPLRSLRRRYGKTASKATASQCIRNWRKILR